MAFQLFQKNKQGDDRHLPSGNNTKFNSIMFSVIDHKHKKIDNFQQNSWELGGRRKTESSIRSLRSTDLEKERFLQVFRWWWRWSQKLIVMPVSVFNILLINVDTHIKVKDKKNIVSHDQNIWIRSTGLIEGSSRWYFRLGLLHPIQYKYNIITLLC